MNRLLLLAGAMAIAAPTFAQNIFSNQSANPNQVALHSSPTSLSGVAAPAGAFFTELQSDGVAMPGTVLNTSAGFGVGKASATADNFRLADDFTITDPAWIVNGIKVYAYATGATSPWLTGGSLNIWTGRPGDSTSSILWSSGALSAANIGQSTSITTNAGTGQHFRLFNSSPGTSVPGTTRLIHEFTFATPNLNLLPGTYWIDYQLERVSGTTFGAVFNPSTTHAGVRGVAGANARQLLSTGWIDVVDSGLLPPNGTGTLTGVTQDVPFVVTGEVIPEPATMTLLALGAAAIAAKRRRKAYQS